MENLGIRTDLLLFFFTFFITFALYPVWINFIYRLKMGEISRVHSEKIGIPTMGGLVFVFTVTITTILFNQSRTQTLLPVFIMTTTGLLGMLEDFAKVFKRSKLPRIFNASEKQTAINKNRVITVLLFPWQMFKELSRIVGSVSESGLETYKKFIVQSLIGGFMAYWVYFKLGWDYIWFPFLGNVHIGIFYPIFVYLLFIVVLNAVAFTDGLDGLAGGLALFSFMAFWALSRILDYNSLAGFCATFIGALIPFLYFNVFPARIMMGNVGSHVLGAVLASLAIVIHREIAIFIIGAVFLVDGISSPLQQLSVKLTKKRLFRMAPIHHHFEKLGWPETKVTLRFWMFGIFFAVLGLFIALL